MSGRLFITFLATVYSVFCFAQTDSGVSCRSMYIEPQLLAGRIIPNYQQYPVSGVRQTVILDIGESNIDNMPWAQYYNHPDIGISLTFSQLGNQSVFGDEIDIIPYIAFNTTRRQKKTWYFKIGLGASYFTRHYDTLANPQNDAIGTPFTWAFRIFAYRTLLVTDRYNLFLEGGYCHSSDGHTALPNLGLNSAMIGIGAQFKQRSVKPDFIYPERKKMKIPATYFLEEQTGIGFHARGSPYAPVQTPKYGVFSSAIAGGVVLKNHIKLRAGLTYRNYGQLMDNQPVAYSSWQSSNIFFSLGCELLVGHFGMDVEAGINLYKPFYRQFYITYEGSTVATVYYLKSIFPVRLGLNYYFLSPYSYSLFNVFIGAHIDANFGQADYSELGIGCSIRL